jgi:hypothetical protein
MFTSALAGLLTAASFVIQTASPTPVPSPSPTKAKSAAKQSSTKSQSSSTSSSTKLQASPSPAPHASPTKPGDQASEQNKAAEALPPSTPVITLNGLCDDHRSSSSSGCTKTITKADFDKLLNMVMPAAQQSQPAMRRNIAQKYVELMAINEAAKQAGVENSQEFALLRMRALSEAYQRVLDEQFRNPPASEIEAYYKEHNGDFVALTLHRIYIPKGEPSGKGTPEEKEAFTKKAAAVADELRDRAAKGEDVDTLQKEAYTKLALPITPPSTQLGPVRKNTLPTALDKELFALNPGGIYKADDPTAFVIYKADKKETLGMDAVKDEIARTLHRQKMEEKLKQINASVKAEYNDTYFGPATTAAAPAVDRDRR